jgi:ABC-2 type transport system permease protein
MSAETISVRGPAQASRLPGLTSATVAARGALRGALIWGAVFGLMVWELVSQFSNQYPTAAARAMLVSTMGSNAGLQAIFGMAHRIDTIGGYTAYHAIGVLGLIGAVWGLLAATRLTRGEEEAGRWELLLAGPTTRRRTAAGALAGLGAGVLVLWAVTAAVTVIAGRGYGAHFSVTASLFLAVAAVAATAMFMAVGALCGQLAATRRQAAAMAAAVFGAAYLIRLIAYADMNLMWLRWASPLGWADELQPLTGSRPLVLLPIAGFTAVLAAAAVVLAGRRDLGASMLPASDTAAARTGLLTGPFGLACRLARRGALGWFAGLAGGGLILGLTAKGTETVFSSQSSGGVIAKLGGTTGGASYLGLGFLIIALVIAMAAAGQAGATRDEEAEGYLDHLLARPVARLPWLAGRFAVSAVVLAVAGLVAGLFTWAGAAATGAGLSLPALLAAGANAVPAAVFVLGAGTLIYGLAPRFTAVTAYGIVAWSFLVEIIGAGVGASRWLLDTSLLHHIARAPATPVNWGSAAVLTAIGAAAAIAGAAAFTRRDLAGA